jgi:retron-type reverse transcriptase|tara:strand:+ start:355 stop:546 length:192 start_codon:yes stop_codon:yes gene_type:complete
VEADIKGFFDNVSHEELMGFLEIRIVDRSLLGLIRRFLEAGYVDDGLCAKISIFERRQLGLRK